MGFGHRVYKNFDPRATIIKAACDKLLAKRNIDDPIFDIAKQLEEVALKDEYFIERKLYPNVDFYSGVIYRAIGIPVQMFTVLFAMGRLPGWIAHWMEMHQNTNTKICRPRQIYVGAPKREFVPMDKRQVVTEGASRKDPCRPVLDSTPERLSRAVRLRRSSSPLTSNPQCASPSA